MIPDVSAQPGPTEIRLKDFPGGASAFEVVAKYCYGMDIELTVENIAPVYCACRVLKVVDLERSTEAFMNDIVLRDPVKAAIVLRVTAGIAHMTEAMMAGLVGHCINAIASMFQPIAELNDLPAECFVVVVKTARDMESNKRTLEQAVLGYLKSHITTENGACAAAVGPPRTPSCAFSLARRGAPKEDASQHPLTHTHATCLHLLPKIRAPQASSWTWSSSLTWLRRPGGWTTSATRVTCTTTLRPC
jgi:hypothetical protein